MNTANIFTISQIREEGRIANILYYHMASAFFQKLLGGDLLTPEEYQRAVRHIAARYLN